MNTENPDTTIRKDRLRTLLAEAFQEYEVRDDAPQDYRPSSDFPVFRLTYDLMRAASLELAGALRPTTLGPNTHSPYDENNKVDFNYYFSDSVYDELSNPGLIISDCVNLISVFYEEAVTADQIDSMIDNLDYIFSCDLLDDAIAPDDENYVDWTMIDDIHHLLRTRLDEIDPPRAN